MNRIYLSRLIVVVCFFITYFATNSNAQRAIPDDNLGYPVLISLKNGMSGSGFYLNSDDAVYLVTAKHVFFEPDTRDGATAGSVKLRSEEARLLSYSRNPAETARNVFAVNLTMLDAVGDVKRHPSEDVVIVKIGVVSNIPSSKDSPRVFSPVAGVEELERSPSGVLGVAVDNLKTFDQILVANDVIVFGYPSSLGLKELPQLDPLRPLLRKGIIAGQNPQKRSIVIDCPSYPGNSGGPVIEIDTINVFQRRFNVIGIVSEFVPFAETWMNLQHNYANTTLVNSGYSIATPMDFVLELVKSFDQTGSIPK